jgi:flagellar hook-associated protein 1
MNGLNTTLSVAANTLSVYQDALSVTQNNVSNSSTSGYAKQRLPLIAREFDTTTGMPGGVRTGDVVSSRDEYAEQVVRRQTTALGEASQNVTSLTALETVFDVSGESGISAALNSLTSAFSAWAASPTDTVARQTVLDRATSVASAFQQTAGDLNRLARDTETQTASTVDEINSLVSTLRDLNERIMSGASNDAGLDAEVHSTLEELAGQTNIAVLKQHDGTFTVTLNGQITLLAEDRQHEISYHLQGADATATYPSAPPSVEIQDETGRDITSIVSGGSLGALLEFHNTTLASYIGDGEQMGSLNSLAQTFADRVNTLLTSGEVSEGPPAVAGMALFTYDSSNPTSTAYTLQLEDSVTAADLAAIKPGSPSVANGTALALSALASPTDTADEIDDMSYQQYYGLLAKRAGQALSEATTEQTSRQSSVAQAKSQRDSVSGVSLDEEAISLLEFQRGYEANSKLITVLNQLMEDTINLLN